MQTELELIHRDEIYSQTFQRPFIQHAFFNSVCTFCATFWLLLFVLAHNFNTHYHHSPFNIHNIFGSSCKSAHAHTHGVIVQYDEWI